MVDNSELAFRMQTRKYGSQLVYTQMFNANSFVVSKECRSQLFEIELADRPLTVQIAGHDPQVMLQAAKYVENDCDVVDINLGCPQGIAKRGRYGAFLMEELDLLYDIVSTLVRGLKIPVTCKTRIYKDFDRSIRLCETLVKAGASVLTIHGRTREEKGQAVGQCDWEMIRRIKEHFSRQDIPIPIIANGGIESVDDIHRCLQITGCDGVMTSEAVLENPAVFSRRINPVDGREMTQIDLAEEYLDFCERYPVYHYRIMRSHIMKMLFKYSAKHSEIRDACSSTYTMEDFRRVCQLCRQFIESEGGESAYPVTWYNRHRFNANTGENENKPRYNGPDQLLDLSNSFLRGNGYDADGGIWECGENEECGVFGSIFGAENAEV
jgi:tRNA-dihydrouridine synthase 1